MKQTMLAMFVLVMLGGCAMGGPASSETCPVIVRRSGEVIVMRGFMGIWSHGMDRLTDRLRADGLDTRIFGYDYWPKLAEQLIAERNNRAAGAGPLVLVGHSYGADSCLELARRLEARRIPVDLIITVECVTPIAVPANVRREVNIYKPRLLDFLPWFRGVPVSISNESGTVLEQINVHATRPDIDRPWLGHVDIDKDPKVQALMEQEVLSVCPLLPDRSTR